MKRQFILCLIILSMFGISFSAYAIPIEYSFYGVGYGLLKSDEFKGKFEMRFSGDTDNVIEKEKGVFLIDGLYGTLYIEKLKVGIITPADIIVLQPKETLLLGFEGYEVIGIDRGAGLDSYDLRSSFGPISTTTPYLDPFHIKTDVGDFLLLELREEAFSANTEINPVPEPSTMLLLGGGLAGLAFWRRRSSKK